jgi:hypothetical protein
MKLKNTQLRYWLAAVLLITAAQNSFAGGMPVRPKQLLLSPSISYFYSNKGWDANRQLKPFANGGEFTSWSYSLYSEYGISRRWAAVASLPYVVNNYEQSDFKNHSQGFTDLEVGIRYYLSNIDYKYFLSLQATGIAPLYNNSNLGYQQAGAELKLSFFGSGHVFGKNCYYSIDNGVRQYFGNSGPVQDRYTGTFGLTIDKKFKHQVSASVGGFYSASNFKRFSPNLATNKDFAFNQASISYGYTFTKQASMFLSAGTFINGRNTGDGRSASISFILRPLKLK